MTQLLTMQLTTDCKIKSLNKWPSTVFLWNAFKKTALLKRLQGETTAFVLQSCSGDILAVVRSELDSTRNVGETELPPLSQPSWTLNTNVTTLHCATHCQRNVEDIFFPYKNTLHLNSHSTLAVYYHGSRSYYVNTQKPKRHYFIKV